jgi:hypothetical protein
VMLGACSPYKSRGVLWRLHPGARYRHTGFPLRYTIKKVEQRAVQAGWFHPEHFVLYLYL